MERLAITNIAHHHKNNLIAIIDAFAIIALYRANRDDKGDGGMTTKHTCNGGRNPVFGRKTAGCPRCDELIAGAPAVVWRNRKEEEARLIREIRAHDCKRSGCGPVCTAFDY